MLDDLEDDEEFKTHQAASVAHGISVDAMSVGNSSVAETDNAAELVRPPLIKRVSSIERAMELQKRISSTAASIFRKSETLRLSAAKELSKRDEPEPEYCPICYTNEITAAKDAVGEL